MANPLAKSVRLRHFSSSHSFRFLPIFLLLFLLLPFFCGTTQKTANGAEKSEMEQHELEEGSGDLFNPDDEDDHGGSGMAPPAEDATNQHNGRTADSATPTSSVSRLHSLADASARTNPQQFFTALSPSDKPRFAVSPTSPPPTSSSVGGTGDEEEGQLREHLHLALLFSLVVLITAVGLGSVALCCFYQRRRRRTRQNRSEDYSAGREQSRHYL